MKNFNKLFLTLIVSGIWALINAESCGKTWYPTQKPPTTGCCGDKVYAGISSSDKREILKTHAAIRNRTDFISSHEGVDVPKLIWDSHLQGFAQTWVDFCQVYPQSYRSIEQFPLYDQLVAKVEDITRYSVSSRLENLRYIIHEWAKNGTSEGNPVWPVTSEQLGFNRIGCAIRIMKDLGFGTRGTFLSVQPYTYYMYYLVCNYGRAEELNEE